MNQIVAYIADRLKEPSTWAAISVLLVAFKVLPNDPSITTSVTTVGVAVAGVLAAIFPESQTGQ